LLSRAIGEDSVELAQMVSRLGSDEFADTAVFTLCKDTPAEDARAAFVRLKVRSDTRSKTQSALKKFARSVGPPKVRRELHQAKENATLKMLWQ
jgi:hypothetical protein